MAHRRPRRVPARSRARPAPKAACSASACATFVEPSPGPPDYTQALGAGAAPRSAQRADRPPRARRIAHRVHQPVTPRSGSPHHAGAAGGRRARRAARRGPHRQRRHATTPFNLVGTGGSRAATLASGAVIGVAADVRRQVVRLAAHLLEAAEDDVELVDGVVSVRGVPASRALARRRRRRLRTANTALLPSGHDARHRRRVRLRHPRRRLVAGDTLLLGRGRPVTGRVRIDRYLVVEDCGAMINPTIVEGQIAGGVAQGIGGVLFERAVVRRRRPAAHVDVRRLPAPDRAEIPRDRDPPPRVARRRARSTSAASARAAPSARPPRCATRSPTRSRPTGAVVLDQHLPPTRILELLGRI